MQTTKAVLVAIALAGVLLPHPVIAQQIRSPYRFVDTRHEVSAFVGSLSPDAGRFGLGPKSGPLFGARYAFDATGPLSLESAVSLLSTTRDVIDPRRVAGDRAIGEEDALITSIDGRLRLTLTGQRTWNRMSPHLLTGGGVVFDAAGRGALDETLDVDDRFSFRTSFIGLLGGGVRVIPSERIGLRGDVLWNLWRLSTPRGFRGYQEADLAEAPESEWVSAPGFSLSLGIRF